MELSDKICRLLKHLDFPIHSIPHHSLFSLMAPKSTFQAALRNPCILFATTQGCWRGDGCEFGHSYASSEKKCRRPRKETREKIKAWSQVVTIVPKWWMFKNDQEFLGYSQELQASTIATFELTVSTLRVIGPWSGCHRRESACALRLTSILILIPQKEHGPPLFFSGWVVARSFGLDSVVMGIPEDYSPTNHLTRKYL